MDFTLQDLLNMLTLNLYKLKDFLCLKKTWNQSTTLR